MSDLSDMYILIISIYRCKQTAEHFLKNCKQLNLNPIIVQLFVYIFHCKYWRAVAQPLIHTSTIIFPWKFFLREMDTAKNQNTARYNDDEQNIIEIENNGVFFIPKLKKKQFFVK